MKNKNEWTEEELAVILNTPDNQEAYKLLNEPVLNIYRSMNSIRGRRKRLRDVPDQLTRERGEPRRSPNWTEEESAIALKAAEEGKTPEETAVLLEEHGAAPRTAEAVRKRLNRLFEKRKLPSAEANFAELTKSLFKAHDPGDPPVGSGPLTRFIEKVSEVQERYREDAIYRNVGLVPGDRGLRKILSISDIHMPFCHEEYLSEALAAHSDADIVVVNGDLLDGYTYSSYEKDKRVLGVHEYQTGFALVKFLSENFPKVVLVNGNHDARLSRLLKKMQWTEEQEGLVRPDLIARIQNGEEINDEGALVEKHNFTNVFYQPNESWYAKVGKTIFAHPWNKGSSQPGFTAKKADQYFCQRYGDNEYDSVVVGHTHKCYKGITSSRLLIEQGTLADLMSYSHSSALNYIDNGVNGYAVIYQDEDGNTDFNLSGFIYLGEVLPPKKSTL